MRRNHATSKSLVIGAAAGLIASWAMNRFFTVQEKISQATGNGQPEQQQQQEQRQQDNPTVKMADKIWTTVARHPLPQEEKKLAGSVVHYVFGALMGSAYAVLAERLRPARSGFGTLYATALWLGADEVMVPALKLSPPPTESSVAQHLSGLGAHLTYGVTMEAARRLLRAAW